MQRTSLIFFVKFLSRTVCIKFFYVPIVFFFIVTNSLHNTSLLKYCLESFYYSVR